MRSWGYHVGVFSSALQRCAQPRNTDGAVWFSAQPAADAQRTETQNAGRTRWVFLPLRCSIAHSHETQRRAHLVVHSHEADAQRTGAQAAGRTRWAMNHKQIQAYHRYETLQRFTQARNTDETASCCTASSRCATHWSTRGWAHQMGLLRCSVARSH
jgi:hypothetical protein